MSADVSRLNFRELLPGLKRLAVLYNPENKSKPGDFVQTREAGEFARRERRGLLDAEPEDIQRVFTDFAASKPDASRRLTESFMIFNARLIVELAQSLGLPSMHSFREPRPGRRPDVVRCRPRGI